MAGSEWLAQEHRQDKTHKKTFYLRNRQRNTSKPNPANVASTIYNKLTDPEGGKNIIAVLVGHQHRYGLKMSDDGRALCVSLPAIRNKHLTSYVAQDSNKFPEWQQGFAVLRDGFLHVLVDGFTDWRYWLGRHYDILNAKRLKLGKGKTA